MIPVLTKAIKVQQNKTTALENELSKIQKYLANLSGAKLQKSVAVDKSEPMETIQGVTQSKYPNPFKLGTRD